MADTDLRKALLARKRSGLSEPIKSSDVILEVEASEIQEGVQQNDAGVQQNDAPNNVAREPVPASSLLDHHQPGHPNLVLTQPGVVHNPDGHNQYTAGKAYRDKLDDVWIEKAVSDPEVIEPDQGENKMCVRCGMRKCDRHLGFDIYAHAACLVGLEKMTAIEFCALQERGLVLRRDDDARTHMRKTFHPAPKTIVLEGDPEKPIAITQVSWNVVDPAQQSK